MLCLCWVAQSVRPGPAHAGLCGNYLPLAAAAGAAWAVRQHTGIFLGVQDKNLTGGG